MGTTSQTSSGVTLLEKPGTTATFRVRDYINGQWVDSQGRETVDIINPATTQVIGVTPLGTTADVDRAVAAAKSAYPSWRQTPVIDRVQILFVAVFRWWKRPAECQPC